MKRLAILIAIGILMALVLSLSWVAEAQKNPSTLTVTRGSPSYPPQKEQCEDQGGIWNTASSMNPAQPGGLHYCQYKGTFKDGTIEDGSGLYYCGHCYIPNYSDCYFLAHGQWVHHPPPSGPYGCLLPNGNWLTDYPQNLSGGDLYAQEGGIDCGQWGLVSNELGGCTTPGNMTDQGLYCLNHPDACFAEGVFHFVELPMDVNCIEPIEEVDPPFGGCHERIFGGGAGTDCLAAGGSILFDFRSRRLMCWSKLARDVGSGVTTGPLNVPPYDQNAQLVLQNCRARKHSVTLQHGVLGCIDTPSEVINSIANHHTAKPPLCWACIDNRPVEITVATAQAKGLQCYSSSDEALRHCKLCWVCINGKPVQMSQADARARDLFCYPTPQDAATHCKPCWICINGKPVQMSEADARAKDLTCYPSPQEALAHCGKLCWVCIDRNVVQISEADALERKLQCYPSKELAQAACDKGPGWCCFDTATGLSVVQKSKADCEKEVGSKWYATEQEARKACEILDCWCCLHNPSINFTAGGSVVHTTKADCRAKGGQCYDSEQDARKACGGGTPPPLCWVCIDRNVQQITKTDAVARKLQCFNSKEEAQRGCGGGRLWCCINGKVVPVPEAQAQARMASTQCYRTKEEAVRACQGGPKIWCCINGQVVQSTEAECRERSGQAYRSEKEARKRCGGGESGGKCWSCVDGKVVQITQSQAQSRGLPCFGSREEATRNCRPKEKENKCWVCINGRVGQVTEAQARQRGLRCYGSREEAASNCSGGGGGPRPTPRPGRRR